VSTGIVLEAHAGEFAIARLAPDAPVPAWADGGAFTTISRSAQELSVLCEAARVPATVRAERGLSALAVRGPLDMGATGILSAIAAPLAAAGIPILAISTFDTDWLFVRRALHDRAVAALASAGIAVTGAAQ
jgi:hypothetical protein